MKKPRISPVIFAFVIMSLFAACKPADRPVPRREAYPRLQLYPAQYSAIDSCAMPARLMVNSHAYAKIEQRDDANWWIDITYPLYNARVYVTLLLMEPNEMPAAIQNRLERIKLDLGAAVATFQPWSANGWEGITVYSPWTLATPVKMIAHNAKCLVSATAFCEGYADAELMVPVAEALRRDIEMLLTAAL